MEKNQFQRLTMDKHGCLCSQVTEDHHGYYEETLIARKYM